MDQPIHLGGDCWGFATHNEGSYTVLYRIIASSKHIFKSFPSPLPKPAAILYNQEDYFFPLLLSLQNYRDLMHVCFDIKRTILRQSQYQILLTTLLYYEYIHVQWCRGIVTIFAHFIIIYLYLLYTGLLTQYYHACITNMISFLGYFLIYVDKKHKH